MARDVKSNLGFLKRDDLYNAVKPYSCRFAPTDGLPRHNLIIETRDVVIHDARPLNPSIQENGFTLASFPTDMSYEDFTNHDKISKIYAPELEDHLKQLLQARHVKVFDYAVRRRHPDFPISTGTEYSNQQPARLVHLDFSREEGIRMLRTLYGEGAEEILQQRWQIINTWRPLKGPLFDWPLAVCDAQTFDAARDAQISDAVYPEWAYENVLIHAHPDQKWYYFYALQDSETMVFKCMDSDTEAIGPCPHGSFPNSSHLTPENPRESVESRAFVMWAGLDKLPEEIGTVYGGRR
ncbi:hypothetical protein J3F84DRAFT_397749 [Trichoderma pleuroticola]